MMWVLAVAIIGLVGTAVAYAVGYSVGERDATDYWAYRIREMADDAQERHRSLFELEGVPR